MQKQIMTTATALAVALLVACGGNEAPVSKSEQSTDESAQQAQYQSLLAQANEAQTEAVAKAKVDCTSNEQCSTLSFRSPLAPCFDITTLDYSTADSANAAEIEAAADRHATAASAAEAIAPPSNVSASCFSQVNIEPLACIDNRCQRGFVFDGPAASAS